ncbi:Glu/Leu/Phe/Val dehydrogenase dimerization domain-containing protein [Pseudoruegeria sp. SK021]|uniref:Leu/Phe/Val dehydrogenase n=1 Tax=Pseudoruegeria sp. SK021 TaxID=1933035 RepID=UPI000A2481CA|nr:Glu/Leu/Phe/Val dehydrogenase dimerization domain-containing protein [Pseudoruegeria sp. SK021]OSP56614.1 amino acid dehydrogenase [Pseudoruegeria sp. SK021]
MLNLPDFDDHEAVTWVSDRKSGLRAVIAQHSTVLGPAAGGCRLWSYGSPEAGVVDALRLSRGMSYKNAMAGLPLGGGKAVIFGPVPADQREAVFEAFGAAVERLAGRYVTAEDVGVSVSDMQIVARQTRAVSGLPRASGSVGGDPSPYTARGVLRGIEVAMRQADGRTDLEGVRVAVQGLGSVGGALCGLLAERGAKLLVADPHPDRVAAVCEATGAKAVPLDAILFQDVDVLAPCALGGILTAEVIGALNATVIAGAANNQLADRAASAALAASDLIYVPDYVINAGGIIVVAAEYLGGQTEADVLDRVDAIGPRVADLLARAAREAVPVDALADQLAAGLIEAAR